MLSVDGAVQAALTPQTSGNNISLMKVLFSKKYYIFLRSEQEFVGCLAQERQLWGRLQLRLGPRGGCNDVEDQSVNATVLRDPIDPPEQGGRLWSHEEGWDLRQAQTALHLTGLAYWFGLSSFGLMSFLFISLSSSLTRLLTLLCEHRQEEWISPIRELLRL